MSNVAVREVTMTFTKRISDHKILRTNGNHDMLFNIEWAGVEREAPAKQVELFCREVLCHEFSWKKKKKVLNLLIFYGGYDHCFLYWQGRRPHIPKNHDAS